MSKAIDETQLLLDLEKLCRIMPRHSAPSGIGHVELEVGIWDEMNEILAALDNERAESVPDCQYCHGSGRIAGPPRDTMPGEVTYMSICLPCKGTGRASPSDGV